MKNETNLSREELLTILEHSFDEIFVTNADGVVVYVNSACANHYGQPPEEMIGKNSKEMTEQNLWGPRLSPLVEHYKKRLTRKQLSCTGVTMLTTASPVFDNHGKVNYIIENVRNITPGSGINHEIIESQNFFNQMDDVINDANVEELTIKNFIAESQEMQEIIKMSRRIAEVNSNVLITGDSGAGKSAIARYIHDRSPRSSRPFIEINCAALPESLIESELFGYKKGAFSGAASQGKKGLIQTAENGTLFLDEVGELPITVQAKLLRFIQDGSYFEVGGTTEKHANCRLIAATNRDLPEMVNCKKFRQDLYYRLKVFEINIPPLAQRRDDIMPLIQFFMDKYNEKYRVNHELSQECITALTNYAWPGNVRELANVVEQIVVMTTDHTITEKHLPSPIRQAIGKINTNNTPNGTNASPGNHEFLSYKESFDYINNKRDELEKSLFTAMYKEFKSSRKIAHHLGISESASYRYLKKYCPELLKK